MLIPLLRPKLTANPSSTTRTRRNSWPNHTEYRTRHDNRAMNTTRYHLMLIRRGVALLTVIVASLVPVATAKADNTTVASITVSSLTPTTVVADGVSTATLTVCAWDASSNPVSDADLTFSAVNAGTFDTPINLGNGCYSDTVHSTRAYPNIFLSARVPNGPEANAGPISFVPGPATKLMCNQYPPIPRDDDETQVITCRAYDAMGNPETTGGDTISMSIPAGVGTLSASVDNGDGTYTWTRTIPHYAIYGGLDDIFATINNSTDATRIFVGVNASATSPETSTFDGSPIGTRCPGTYDTETRCVHANYVHPTSVPADGASTVVIYFVLLDKYSQISTSDAATAVVSCSTSLPGSAINVMRGFGGYYYQLYLTSTTPGTSTVSCSINGASVPNVATVRFAAVPPPPAPTPPPPAPTPPSVPTHTPPPPAPTVGISNHGGDEITLRVDDAPSGSHASWQLLGVSSNDWVSIGDGNSIAWDAHCVPAGQYQLRAVLAEADGTTRVLSAQTLTITHSEAPLPTVAIADVRRAGSTYTLDASASYAVGGSRPVCVSWLVDGVQVSDQATTTITLSRPARIELLVSSCPDGYRQRIRLGEYGYRRHLVAVSLPQERWGVKSTEIQNVLNRLDSADAALARRVWLLTARRLGHGHLAGEYGLTLRGSRMQVLRSSYVWRLLGAVKGGRMIHTRALDALVQVSQRDVGRPSIRKTQLWLFDSAS